ncbi:MAG: AMP-binding protein [Burkholderiaceae bacterium]
MLQSLGAKTGDLAFAMIPRIPAWYQVMVGCCKAGVVAMPGTNSLTAKDIEYRINRAGARLAIVTADGAARVDQIRAKCLDLEILIVIGGQREGWVDYHAACAAASPCSSVATAWRPRAAPT